MHRQLLLCLLAGTLLATVVKAQPLNIRDIAYLKDSLHATRSDSLRTAYLSRIALGYFNHRKEIPSWYDSLFKYQQRALQFSQQKGYKTWTYNMQSLEANTYLMTGQHLLAFACVERMQDSNAIRRLSDWAYYYMGITKIYSMNMDSALYCLQKAIPRSQRLKDSALSAQVYQYLGFYYCRTEDTLTGKKMMAQAAAYRRNDPEYTANMWLTMNNATPMTTKNLQFKYYYLGQIIAYCTRPAISEKPSMQRMAGRAYMSLGDQYDYQGKDSQALATYLKAIPLQEAGKDPRTFALYNRLHDKYYYTGNLDKAMVYAVKGLKGAEAANVRNLHFNYFHLGNCCFEMGQIAESIGYYEKAFVSSRNSDGVASGAAVKKMTRALIAAGRSTEVLPFIQQAMKTYRFPFAVDSMLLQEALGIYYDAQGQYEQAAKCYRQMTPYLAGADSFYISAYQYAWARHYFKSNQYEKAVPYLHYCLQQSGSFFPRFSASEVYMMLYQIDSARGQHQAALQHYRSHRVLSDSIYSIRQKEQLETLRLQFDLGKKDHELQLNNTEIKFLTKEKLLQEALAAQTRQDALLKQQSIDLLTQEAEMQDLLADKQATTLLQQQKELALQKENIGLLKEHELEQAARLQQANFIKQLTIGGVVLLLIIVALLYSRYHNRKKTSQQISEKNEKLQQLVEEKEWLLKEVHHRVKNNLQVVLSLLQSQSAYLQDDALAAVHISQHRVQAMTLIHQKLYQTDNVATIDMSTYIPELVAYLQDSFPDSGNIRFTIDTAPVMLDVKQAIPLGLIINEAVTNVFKHAFPAHQQGHLSIALQWYNKEEIVLDIKDNGIGIQADYNNTRNGSLGMSLMKGLCSDFQARYSIRNERGTHVQVIFPANLNRTQ